MDDEPTTRELELEVLQRELGERRAAEEAPDPDERHTHERRAERAEYLREKLAERAESERQIEEG
jgi:hypothetical protein